VVSASSAISRRRGPTEEIERLASAVMRSVTDAAAGPVAAAVQELGDADLPDLSAFLDADPLVNVVIRERLDTVGSLAPARLGGAIHAVRDEAGAIRTAVFSGGNILPLGGDADGYRRVGEQLARRHRIASSIVGRADDVAALREQLETAWGRPRLVRERQPLLVADAPPPAAATRRFPPVRVMHPADLESYLPAAVAMFREELDLAPLSAAGTAQYRRRVAKLLRDGRAFGVVDAAGTVVFKADVGSVSAHTCQVQGVWTRPYLRGQGLATEAMADVLRQAFAFAPTVSLYVNDFNTAARRLYERLGMRAAATLTTVLF
jgi:predicted GNAT family acetyltransferase